MWVWMLGTGLPELPLLPALACLREAVTPWPGTSLTREQFSRPQAPQGPVNDPSTPLQGGQEGGLVL